MSHAMTWGESPTSDDKMWGMVAHLSSFIFPFLGPLALYLIFWAGYPLLEGVGKD